jgi:2-phosphosulfolactate phosphatase
MPISDCGVGHDAAVRWPPIQCAIDDVGDIRSATVVVDVLRAFSFAACALSVGAPEVLLVAELDDALRLKAQVPDSMACKDGQPVDGFEFFNSPAVVLEQDLTGHVVVQRTSAGTKGALAARHARPLLCASFLTAGATASLLRASVSPQPIAFVITGDRGHADEDLACAEYITALVNGAEVEPDPFIARATASSAADSLREGVRLGYPGVHSDDVSVCLKADRFDFALAATDEGEFLRLRAHT